MSEESTTPVIVAPDDTSVVDDTTASDPPTNTTTTTTSTVNNNRQHPSGKTVIVKNIPCSALFSMNDELNTRFSKYGVLTYIKRGGITVHHDTVLPTLSAYINYDNINSAEEACIHEHNTTYNGNTIQVHVLKGGPYSVFISNLPYNITEATLTDLLSPCGTIQHIVKIPARPTAFLDFEDEEGMKKALSLNGSLLINNTEVILQKKDEQRPSAKQKKKQHNQQLLQQLQQKQQQLKQQKPQNNDNKPQQQYPRQQQLTNKQSFPNKSFKRAGGPQGGWNTNGNGGGRMNNHGMSSLGGFGNNIWDNGPPPFPHRQGGPRQGGFGGGSAPFGNNSWGGGPGNFRGQQQQQDFRGGSGHQQDFRLGESGYKRRKQNEWLWQQY